MMRVSVPLLFRSSSPNYKAEKHMHELSDMNKINKVWCG